MTAVGALDTRTDAYETICDAGRAAADSLDEGRFTLGQLAVSLGYRVMHFSPKALMTEPEMCVALVLKAIGYKPKKAKVKR